MKHFNCFIVLLSWLQVPLDAYYVSSMRCIDPTRGNSVLLKYSKKYLVRIVINGMLTHT